MSISSTYAMHAILEIVTIIYFGTNSDHCTKLRSAKAQKVSHGQTHLPRIVGPCTSLMPITHPIGLTGLVKHALTCLGSHSMGRVSTHTHTHVFARYRNGEVGVELGHKRMYAIHAHLCVHRHMHMHKHRHRHKHKHRHGTRDTNRGIRRGMHLGES